jgi:uncharacterized coiled-coil protein SlyX
MDNESPTITALHALYVRLASLREIEVSERGGETPLDYQQVLIEEAFAALSQVETEVDALRTELEYHHQRFDAEKTQQSEHRSESKEGGDQ